MTAADTGYQAWMGRSRRALRVSVCTSLLASSCWAQVDLSLLSDFGRPDIALATLGIGDVGSNAAGIVQTGHRNKASIEQTGGLGNTAQVWQIGSDLSADIAQNGNNNDIRLSQTTNFQNADLTQIGVGNQMAVIQLGSGDTVTGSQEGVGNQFVLQQGGGTNFQFSQVGDGNQMVVDLAPGLSMQIHQVGNNLSAEVRPGP